MRPIKWGLLGALIFGAMMIVSSIRGKSEIGFGLWHVLFYLAGIAAIVSFLMGLILEGERIVKRLF